ncbi:MAG TPA: hypothetical protein VGK19_07295 [Capsulimonadaceae bacterium]|jgi:hypothetical protein
MDRILEAVLAAAKPGGSTYQYYVKNAAWESDLRRQIGAFPEFVVAAEDKATLRAKGVELLTALNTKCKARCADPAIPIAFEAMNAVVEARGWWKGTPPDLLMGTDEDLVILADAMGSIMATIARSTTVKPYSLLTKYLHYAFPNSFAAYDNRVGASVLAWVKDVYGIRPGPNLARQRYAPDVLTTTDGLGYIGILRFFQMFWDGVAAADQVETYDAAVAELQAALDELPGEIELKLNRLDILDKVLSVANGDRKLLHL